MEKKLKVLFDYQHFQRNFHLASLIEKTEKKYPRELSDDDLELVNAAGDIDSQEKKKAVKPEASDND